MVRSCQTPTPARRSQLVARDPDAGGVGLEGVERRRLDAAPSLELIDPGVDIAADAEQVPFAGLHVPATWH